MPSEPQMPEWSRLHAFASGRVQGVGFRWHARQQARQLGLTGWVRNLADGRVEILAEGPRAALEALLAWCRQGSPSSQVDDLSFSYEAARGEFASFEAIR